MAKVMADIPKSLYANIYKIKNGSAAAGRILAAVQLGAESRGSWMIINTDEELDYTEFQCPCCGEVYSTGNTVPENTKGDIKWKFCPMCGQNMRR